MLFIHHSFVSLSNISVNTVQNLLVHNSSIYFVVLCLLQHLFTYFISALIYLIVSMTSAALTSFFTVYLIVSIMSAALADTVSSVIQVQLVVLCSGYQGYESRPPACTITLSNITSRPPTQQVDFSATVAFDRPVVGPQSLQSLTGMMYSGGVSNGRYGPTPPLPSWYHHHAPLQQQQHSSSSVKGQ